MQGRTWIRTKNNPESFRGCVTVTPRGTRICGLDSQISPRAQFPKCIRVMTKTRVFQIGDPEITLSRTQTPSNSRPKSRLNEWRCSQIVVVPWPTRPVMERTTFLKNYRIRLQYDGTPYQPFSAGPATSYEAVDERTGEPVSVTLIPAASIEPAEREGFEEHISSAQKLQHANIAASAILGAKETITFTCPSGLRVRHLRHGYAATDRCRLTLHYEWANRS